ncbi:MAG TPA: hypothetical protein H9958_01855 [Candidatus Limosilactobacillus intestinavium]|nr:hypothetical protein [Candidatus Limosilactobacillus intestinavium]
MQTYKEQACNFTFLFKKGKILTLNTSEKRINMLEDYLKNNCPLEVPGLLSLAIEKAYKQLDDTIKTVPILQKDESRKSYGYLRNAFVDVAIENVFSELGHDCIIETKKVNPDKKNSYTYQLLRVPGAHITPVKSQSKGAFPRKAIYRDKGSLLNYQMSLFDEQYHFNNDKVPFMLLTYGGANYKLDYVMLGIPDFEDKNWIDLLSIKGKPALISSNKEKQINDKLKLSLTEKASQIRRNNNDSNGGNAI